MNNSLFENKFVTYHWENEVVVITFKKISITLEAAKEIVQDRLKFIQGKTYPVLSDSRAINGADKSALDYFDTNESVKGVSATSIVVESFISKFLANNFLRLNKFKNKVPTRIFNNKRDALKWLKQYK